MVEDAFTHFLDPAVQDSWETFLMGSKILLGRWRP